MKRHLKIIAAVLCIVLTGVILCGCAGNEIKITPPDGQNYWQIIKDEKKENPLNGDITPNITITQIGEKKEDIIGGALNDNSDIYDIVYENVSFTLQAEGFTTSSAVAIDYDNNNGNSALGLMYYYDDLNLFTTNEQYAAGFYEILSEEEVACNFDNSENLLLQNMEEQTNTMYLGVYDYEDIGYDHFVFENKYIVYYQESNNTIRYIEKENKKENYDLTLGSLYDYDNNQFIYDEDIFGEYKDHSGVGLITKEEYDALEKQLEEIAYEQEKRGYEVSEFKIVYISPESIQSYLVSEEEDTFFGYKVEDLEKEFGIGTALRYTPNGFQEATILPDGSYNWKSFLIKMGIGCGIILVGAILTPLIVSGASFGCAFLTISQTAVNFALVASLEQLVDATITGIIEGKSILESLKNGAFAGLDAFANGFMIGAAIGSVGVMSGLIKPKACFTAGTEIALGNGVTKAIEKISVGDYVLSYNENTEEVSKQKVIDIFNKQVNQTIKLSVMDEIIETTSNHPFYMPEQNGWKEAGNLKRGDIVLNSRGSEVKIESVNVINHFSSHTVYNFTVENNHTYFVGEQEVLVHNSCKKLTDKEINNARSKAGKKAKKEALKDLIENRNIKKYGFDTSNPQDLEVLEFIQKNKRFPSYAKGDKLQCDFAHAVDVNKIKKAFNDGKITKQQALDFISDSRNGILTSRNNHYLLHGKKWTSVTNVAKAIKLRPSIKNFVNIVLESIT